MDDESGKGHSVKLGFPSQFHQKKSSRIYGISQNDHQKSTFKESLQGYETVEVKHDNLDYTMVPLVGSGSGGERKNPIDKVEFYQKRPQKSDKLAFTKDLRAKLVAHLNDNPDNILDEKQQQQQQ